VIPGGTYRGVDSDTGVIGVTNILVASSDLDEELAYQIVKLMFDRKAALEAAHPEARHLEVPGSTDASPAPFHPGAVRYYREHGWP
jgi:hypothetical protein